MTADMRLHWLAQSTRLPWVAEHKFCDSRRWRFDYACLQIATAIEIEGGAYTRGRHTRGKGFVSDLEKYNTAQLFGWVVLRYTPQQFDAGAWLPDVEAAAARCANESA